MIENTLDNNRSPHTLLELFKVLHVKFKIKLSNLHNYVTELNYRQYLLLIIQLLTLVKH